MPIIGQISVGDGATFTPAVDNDGVISWSNNKNLPNPASVDIPQTVMDRYLIAPIASPAFTGNPTAPTQAKTDDSTKLATTAYVKAVVADYLALTGGSITGNVAITGDLSVSGAITGNLTGNVTGNLTGNVTGNVTGDVTGDVTGTASGNLALTGGTMTGPISFETTGEIGYRATTHTQPAQSCKQLIVSATDIDHWADDGGAKLTLHTYDSTGTNTREDGAFSLIATDGTAFASLVGRKDGVLTWNDHNVFTSSLTTGAVTPLRGTLSYSYLNKTGNLVQCGGCLTNISDGSTTSWVSLVKLPAGFIPSGRLDFVAANNASGWGIQAYIDTDGTVYAWPAGGAITSVRWNVCYFVSN